MHERPPTLQWVYILGAAGVGGALQLAALLTRDYLPAARQIGGAVVISIVMAALITAVGIDKFGLSAVTAGGLGIVSGFIPGAAWVNIAYKALEAQLREKLKVELDEKKEEADGGA